LGCVGNGAGSPGNGLGAVLTVRWTRLFMGDPTKLSLGEGLIRSLAGLKETLESGVPLSERYTVRTVCIPDPWPADEPDLYSPEDGESL
jgi:hypothetical protein